jgi:hypothetical protein
MPPAEVVPGLVEFEVAVPRLSLDPPLILWVAGS